MLYLANNKTLEVIILASYDMDVARYDLLIRNISSLSPRLIPHKSSILQAKGGYIWSSLYSEIREQCGLANVLGVCNLLATPFYV